MSVTAEELGRAYLAGEGLPPLPSGHLIDGRFQPSVSGDEMESFDPGLGTAFASFAAGSADDVALAVSSAARGLAIWRQTCPAARHRVLQNAAGLIRETSPLLSLMDTLDSGKTLSEAKGDVESAARMFDYYAAIAETLEGSEIPLGQDQISFTRREPVGVTAHIIPWNYPTSTFARGVAPALAAGCSVVAKPAETTPFTALLMADLLLKAGLPPGVVNVVTGLGAEVGAPLAAHPSIRHLTFTGSVATGVTVAQAAAQRVASVTLELGGKSPLIALSDCDPDAVAQGAIWAIFSNAGQVCSAGSRLIVHHSVHSAVVTRLVALTEALRVGHGLRSVDMGAINSTAQRDKISGYVEGARARGRNILTGGQSVRTSEACQGWFYAPTLIDDLPTDDPCVVEEIFGPVLAIQIVDSDEEALNAANGTEFGLMAGIYSQDIGRALAMARDLDSGQVTINDYWAGGVAVPFGGRRLSGYGREKGREGVSAYLSTKAITVRLPASSAKA